MSPSVITSKAASNDLAKIKVAHANIVDGMTNQKMRVDQFNQQRDQQRAADMQNQQTMQNELQKSKMTANSADMKTALDFQSKQADQEIQRAQNTTT